jgi:hypothetical protein
MTTIKPVPRDRRCPADVWVNIQVPYTQVRFRRPRRAHTRVARRRCWLGQMHDGPHMVEVKGQRIEAAR